MPIDPDARQRLADAMEQRRAELRLRWQDVAAKSGVSLKALLNARTGPADIRPLTQRGIEEGLQWPQGTVERILDGLDPVAHDTALQGQAVTPSSTAGSLTAPSGDTDAGQSRVTADTTARDEIVAHVGQVAARHGITISGPGDMEKVKALKGADLYPGKDDLSRILAGVWDIEVGSVSLKFDLMARTVLKHPAGRDSNLRSALPAQIPAPRAPIPANVTERVASITYRA
jgi:hypothetical protein